MEKNKKQERHTQKHLLIFTFVNSSFLLDYSIRIFITAYEKIDRKEKTNSINYVLTDHSMWIMYILTN